MLNVLVIALGGALGSVGRHLLGGLVREWTPGAFPVATLVVNLLGSFAMGVVAGGVTPGTSSFLFLTTGVLGGFTTYSAFNQESLGLFESGSTATAIFYIAATLVGGLALGFAGLRLVRAAY